MQDSPSDRSTEVTHRATLRGRIRRAALKGAAIGAAPALAVLGVEAAGLGTWWTIPLLLGFLGMCAALMSIVLLPFRRTRERGAVVGVASLAFLAVTYVGFELRWTARHFAFERLADRSEPLVRAIKEFEQSRFRPPESLSELVPDFLPAVPRTGMWEYPDYEYYLSEPDRPYGLPRWQLHVPCSLGLFNWDTFVYWPTEQYPRFMMGGATEQTGEWVYVHE